MGDMGDDVVDGACCAFCGIYFVRPHGYPVACSGCWEEDCGVDEATKREV